MDASLLRQILTNLAEYSNNAAVVIIILSFLFMVVFITRLVPDQLSTKISMMPGSYIPAQMMSGVHNPFSISLCSDRVSSVADGAWLDIRSHVDYVLQPFWGVDISKLYPSIYKQWRLFEAEFRNDMLFDELCKLKGSQEVITSLGEHRRVNLKPVCNPDVQLDLGPVPRSCYPLVVVMIAKDNDVASDAELIVCTVVIIHLKDEVCPGDSHVISQYIRTARGQPYCLQQLYVASSDSDAGEPSEDVAGQQSSPTAAAPSDSPADNEEVAAAAVAPPTEVPSTEPGECIICQVEPISRALLPCRHVCVCDTCFQRLDRCPMCRSGIQSYFRLDGPSDMWEGEDEEEEDGVQDNWFNRMNFKLNNLLGFT